MERVTAAAARTSAPRVKRCLVPNPGGNGRGAGGPGHPRKEGEGKAGSSLVPQEGSRGGEGESQGRVGQEAAQQDDALTLPRIAPNRPESHRPPSEGTEPVGLCNKAKPRSAACGKAAQSGRRKGVKAGGRDRPGPPTRVASRSSCVDLRRGGLPSSVTETKRACRDVRGRLTPRAGVPNTAADDASREMRRDPSASQRGADGAAAAPGTSRRKTGQGPARLERCRQLGPTMTRPHTPQQWGLSCALLALDRNIKRGSVSVQGLRACEACTEPTRNRRGGQEAEGRAAGVHEAGSRRG